MHDGSPSTPAEIATARALMAETRHELGLLVGAGVSGLAPSLASLLVGEAVLGGSLETTADAMAVEVAEQDGGIFVIASRSGRPFLGFGG
jgi:hypothetical protein